jgi:hypothetical protein
MASFFNNKSTRTVYGGYTRLQWRNESAEVLLDYSNSDETN